jgi:hypothetical protein
MKIKGPFPFVGVGPFFIRSQGLQNYPEKVEESREFSRSQFVTLKKGHAPNVLAFTGQGVVMFYDPGVKS